MCVCVRVCGVCVCVHVFVSCVSDVCVRVFVLCVSDVLGDTLLGQERKVAVNEYT